MKIVQEEILAGTVGAKVQALIRPVIQTSGIWGKVQRS